MTIASAITALSPWIYWKLDETTGTVAADSSGHGINGTISGDLQMGVTGPEIETKALRLYSTGKVVSPALSLSAWNSTSILYWFTSPAQGGDAARKPVLTIGPPGDPFNRGFLSALQSNAAQALLYTMTSVSAQTVGSVPWPQPYWHLLAWFRDAVANTYGYSVDGGAWNTSSGSPGTVWQTTDPLQIVGNTPIVVAHVAVFTQALTQVQVQTISTQVQPWPYEIPSNQIPVTSGGGGLTTDQDTTLSSTLENTEQILTNWGDYQTVTLPSLQDALNALASQSTAIQNTLNGWVTTLWQDTTDAIGNVLNGVTSTITTAAGDVAQSVGQLLSQHSKDVLGLANATGGPTCSNVDLDISETPNWGVIVNITTRPDVYWPMTPDSEWSKADLAVIVLERAGEAILRRSVHTNTETISPIPDLLPMGVLGVAVPLVPPEYHVKVFWAQGVCGEVLLQYVP